MHDLYNFIWFLIIGVVCGGGAWVVSMLMSGGGRGIVADILVGTVGAFMGAIGADLFSITVMGFWGSFLIWMMGSIVLLVVFKTIFRNANPSQYLLSTQLKAKVLLTKGRERLSEMPEIDGTGGHEPRDRHESKVYRLPEMGMSFINERGSMTLTKKAVLLTLLMAAGFSSVQAAQNTDYHPTNDGGNFGLGLEVGQPGNWGVVGKIWVDRENAFAPAVKFDNGGVAILQLDYLWHDFDIIHMKDSTGSMPLYIGVGGDLSLQNNVQIAPRVPVGISYIFDKKNVPLDIYLQAVPTLWFYTNGTTSFNVYGELGAHYYF